jgi:ABC-type sugar transport system ATPase subunit
VATLDLVGVTLGRSGGPPILDDVSLSVADGEFLVVVGPSGSGKTSLLRIVAGLEAPTRGEVLIGGRPATHLSPRDRNLAMVFQNYALYPHMTVRDNLGFGLAARRTPRAQIATEVERVADLLGIRAHLDKKPGVLSGGERQRVALGRALVRKPAAFLYDEPLSNLDARLREEMRGEIARLHARFPTTSLYVTHDQAEAMTLGQRMAIMADGRLRQLGPPAALYARPADTFVAGFLGSPQINLIEGIVEGGVFRSGGMGVRLSSNGPLAGGARGRVVLGVRPDEIAVERAAAGPAEDGDAVPAGVLRREHLGREVLVYLDAGGTALRALVAPGAAPREGEAARLRFDRARVHLFDAASGRRIVPAGEDEE